MKVRSAPGVDYTGSYLLVAFFLVWLTVSIGNQYRQASSRGDGPVGNQILEPSYQSPGGPYIDPNRQIDKERLDNWVNNLGGQP